MTGTSWFSCQVGPPPASPVRSATNRLPDLGPAFPAALTERARVAFGSHGPAIGIVVELDQFFAPPDEHRVIGVEQDPDRGAQALRPAFRRPSGFDAQSWARVSAPISPPPARKSAAARFVEIQHRDKIAWLTGRTKNSRNLAAWHHSAANAGPDIRSKYTVS